MSTQELRLRYFIQLASNIGVTARRDAQEYERSQAAMVRVTRETDRSARDLERTLASLASNTAAERQVRYFDRLADSVGRARDRARQLKESLVMGVQNAPELMAGGAAGYYAGRAVLAPPVRAFATLEEAVTDLRVAMMDNTGRVGAAFAAIARESEKLGDLLPGATKDFTSAASALIRQGISPDVVANGGLRASANFGVLMNMPQAQAAETIAKVREANGLADNELVPMADLMQRGHFAFGINPSDYLEVAKYAAPTYNTMGTTGLENARRMLALQGMAASVGLEGSSFGTNIAQMMNRLSQVDSRQNRNSAEAKALRQLLGKSGIDLQFYDDKGQFMGPENMLKQLAKLRTLSPVEQQRATYQLFGDEAGRPAQVMIQKGLEEYQKNLAKLDAQASLDQRINEKMSSFAAKLESLGGTIENVMARLGAPLGNAAKPGMDAANSWVSGFGGYVQDHPIASTAGLLGLSAVAAAGAWRGGSALMGLVRGGRGAAAVAPAAAAAASNPFRGLGVSMPPTPAAPSFMQRLGGASRYLGPAAAAAGLGLESYDVITDDGLTAMGKAKGLSAAAVGALGAWGGAKAGALLGSAVLPGIGTVAGGLLGGAAGYMAGNAGTNWLWGNNPQRDYVRLTAPSGQTIGSLPGNGQATVQIGEGTLRIDVQVRSDGTVGTSTSVLQPMQLLRLESGGTDPGSFAGMSGGAR
jgi:TP901 family phage tail tape measure protein